eukprot:GHVU01083426.1.p1 GENE.GHVU01083426.1~~GHVU01083426.1.p1  ORF type:complete len:128 (-),score=12.85 GHVU01083426.1:193-576(-)
MKDWVCVCVCGFMYAYASRYAGRTTQHWEERLSCGMSGGAKHSHIRHVPRASVRQEGKGREETAVVASVPTGATTTAAAAAMVPACPTALLRVLLLLSACLCVVLVWVDAGGVADAAALSSSTVSGR